MSTVPLDSAGRATAIRTQYAAHACALKAKGDWPDNLDVEASIAARTSVNDTVLWTRFSKTKKIAMPIFKAWSAVKDKQPSGDNDVREYVNKFKEEQSERMKKAKKAADSIASALLIFEEFGDFGGREPVAAFVEEMRTQLRPQPRPTAALSAVVTRRRSVRRSSRRCSWCTPRGPPRAPPLSSWGRSAPR